MHGCVGFENIDPHGKPPAILCAGRRAAKPDDTTDASVSLYGIAAFFTDLTAASGMVTILLLVSGDLFRKNFAHERVMPPNSRTREILARLSAEYPDASCSLDFRSPLELLIATILSAQCTDERVNQVTKSLFKKYRKARDYASAALSELEKDIQSTGFFRNKAKSIQACCERLDREFGGNVPQEMDVLVELPGIGRKTANVVLGTAFGIPSGIVVDTHVARISRRLGFTEQTDPVKIEQDLMAIIPQSEWIAFSHRMIKHGRRYCQAKKPNCGDCPLADLCPKIGTPEEVRSPLASRPPRTTRERQGTRRDTAPQRRVRSAGSRGKEKNQ
ncbi:hypothetical protein JCM17478_13730 [Thermopirellula anaerolimosa]